MIGKTLGHYQITNDLGKGGMGEVFQAKDQVLGREVAIKILPEEFARDADRIARFQREAKVLASLNHPNIAAIHGLEESGETNFLVLELVEGQTLREHIEAGSIPVEEVLKLAVQIADALEAAHDKGIIHRDLKPANIKITPDGKAKVLDFGLAKAYAGEKEEVNLPNSPTLSDAATRRGVILGTAAYMSPEQAKAKAVDKRADIWAFGCVLYEMLTGQAAFQGEDVTEILASVVKGGANLDLLPANTHPRVREAVVRCLQKDLKRRYRDIADARYEIERALADPSGVLVQPFPAAEPRRKLGTILRPAATLVLLGMIIEGVAVWNLKPTPPQKRPLLTRYSLEVDGSSVGSGMTLSADGSRLVYGAADKSGVRQLFLRARDQMAAVPVRDTKDATHPFFSPDGNWVGFFSGSELKKVSLSGGLAQTLCKAGSRFGASWGPDDTIVFAASDSPGLMRVSASGGEPKPLTNSETGPGGHRWPEFLPDGKAVLYTISRGRPSAWQVAVLSLKTNKSRVLIDGTDAHFASSGHLVFAREGSLWAAPFDGAHLELKGEAAPIVEGVQVGTGGWAHYTLSNDGSLAYLPGTFGLSPPRRLTWVDRKGKEEPIAVPPNQYASPSISPDGKRLALTVGDDAGDDIRIWDFARETLTRLTFDTKSSYPLWTPDGKRIVFMSTRDGSPAVYWKAADGTGEDEKLASVPNRVLFPMSWSRDGKTLVLIESGGSEKADIVALPMEGDHARKKLLHEKHSELLPQISPDGRWMAYVSDESGRPEVYVRPFPDVDKGKWQVSGSGGDFPLWSRDGRELFYRSGNAVTALTVKTEPTFTPGKAETLFEGETDPWPGNSPFRLWAVDPDRERFLILRSGESATDAAAETGGKINIVLNWFEELKRLVPIGK